MDKSWPLLPDLLRMIRPIEGYVYGRHMCVSSTVLNLKGECGSSASSFLGANGQLFVVQLGRFIWIIKSDRPKFDEIDTITSSQIKFSWSFFDFNVPSDQKKTGVPVAPWLLARATPRPTVLWSELALMPRVSQQPKGFSRCLGAARPSAGVERLWSSKVISNGNRPS